MTDKKEMKIEFAPGAFDSFEGTQEELNELIAQITAMAESGELAENSTELNDDEWDELPDEVKLKIIQSFDDSTPPRNLQ